MQLAPMPDHGRVGRPDWQPLWADYAPVTTPLRALGMPVDIETCGGETHITVDLPDGSFLLIAGTDSLPNRLSTVTGWRVMRGHEDNPTVDLGIYDSTVDGEQNGNGPDLTAMLGAVTAWLLAEYPQTVAYLEAQTAVSSGFLWPHRSRFEWPHFWSVGVTVLGSAGKFQAGVAPPLDRVRFARLAV